MNPSYRHQLFNSKGYDMPLFPLSSYPIHTFVIFFLNEFLFNGTLMGKVIIIFFLNPLVESFFLDN